MKSQDDKIVKMKPDFLISTALKGISQVILLEDAISGLIILIAITIANYKLGIITLSSAIIGVLVAYITGADVNDIKRGLFGYNSVLIGLALSMFLTGSTRWIIALLGAACAIIFTAAMMNLLKKLAIPVLTFPYIVLTWFLLLTSYRLEAFRLSSSLVPQDLSHWQLKIGGDIDVIHGLVTGIGQIYFQDKFLPGILVILAVFWSSRKLGVYTIIGTVISWLTAYALGPEHSVLNLGLYGYNSVLTILGVASVFNADSHLALLWGIVAAILTVPITAGVDALLTPYGLPTLTMPFVIVTWIFISARKVLPEL